MNGITQPVPGTPWTVVLKVNAMDLSPMQPAPLSALVLSDSTNKFIVFGLFFANPSAALGLTVGYWPSGTNATWWESTWYHYASVNFPLVVEGTG